MVLDGVVLLRGGIGILKIKKKVGLGRGGVIFRHPKDSADSLDFINFVQFLHPFSYSANNSINPLKYYKFIEF
jgi:hypothetical protein